MRGGFDTGWEDRWSGLANGLEVILENRIYRLILCSLTVILLVAYAVAGARMAAPPLLKQPYGLEVRLSEKAKSLADDPWALDQLNRRLSEVDHLRSQLPFTPTKLHLELDHKDLAPGAFSARVLRLWLDEYLSLDARGAAAGGSEVGAVEEEAVIRAILMTENGERGDKSRSWYESALTMGAYCESGRLLPIGWDGLCQHVKEHPESTWAKAMSPMSLADWLANEMVLDAVKRPLTERALLLAVWFRTLKEESLKNWPEWPVEKSRYGLRLETSVARLAPHRLADFDPEPKQHLMVVDRVEDLERRVSEDVKIDTVVLSSCSSPRWRDLERVRARHFLWVRGCGGAAETALKELKSDLAWADRVDAFARNHPELSFVEIGVSEVKLALAKGWIKSGDYLDVAVQFDGIANSARPTERTWLRSLRAYRFKAPVEVVKLVRLQTSGAL